MFLGWFFSHGRWHLVCEHTDLGECHRLLLASSIEARDDTGRRRRLTMGSTPRDEERTETQEARA